MDPSSTQEWRSGVEGAINRLESNMQEMMSMLDKMSSSPSPKSASPPNPKASKSGYQVSPIYEPRLSPPEVFKGEQSQCRPFITQCEIVFELQPSSFPTERAKVAYAISLLSGKAKLWGTAEWQKDSLICYQFKDFSKELIRVFDPVLPEREAARGLLKLKQGRRRVTEYIIDFHALSSGSDWNDEALCDAFYQGLSEEVKDELSTRDAPRDLEELETLAARIDMRLHERRLERSSFSRTYQVVPVPRPQPSVSTPPVSSSPIPPAEEPMQIGRSRLSPQERERRLKRGLCFYCGGEGHLLRLCPAKGQAQ